MIGISWGRPTVKFQCINVYSSLTLLCHSVHATAHLAESCKGTLDPPQNFWPNHWLLSFIWDLFAPYCRIASGVATSYFALHNYSLHKLGEVSRIKNQRSRIHKMGHIQNTQSKRLHGKHQILHKLKPQSTRRLLFLPSPAHKSSLYTRLKSTYLIKLAKFLDN